MKNFNGPIPYSLALRLVKNREIIQTQNWSKTEKCKMKINLTGLKSLNGVEMD